MFRVELDTSAIDGPNDLSVALEVARALNILAQRVAADLNVDRPDGGPVADSTGTVLGQWVYDARARRGSIDGWVYAFSGEIPKTHPVPELRGMLGMALAIDPVGAPAVRIGDVWRLAPPAGPAAAQAPRSDPKVLGDRTDRVLDASNRALLSELMDRMRAGRMAVPDQAEAMHDLTAMADACEAGGALDWRPADD